MKIKRILIIVYVLIASFAYSQKDINNQGEKTKIRGINEISYQMPLAIGYNHIQNFNDKLLIGAGLHLGYGKYYLPQYSDFFFFKMFTRNLLNKTKFNKRIDYDIGAFVSISSVFETVFYGISTALYVNVYKFKLGINTLFGPFNNDNKTYFPGYTIAPLVIYKF